MIHNKKEETAEYRNPIPVDPGKYARVILWPTLSILAVIIVLFIVADGAALVVTSIITIIRKIAYNSSVKKCLKQREEMEAEFTEIAELFS